MIFARRATRKAVLKEIQDRIVNTEFPNQSNGGDYLAGATDMLHHVLDIIHGMRKEEDE